MLAKYEKAFGQLANFAKSAICFGRQVSDVEGMALANSLGVRKVTCHERYLGLPIFAFRSKQNLFSYIKDRIWERLIGWQRKLFSIAGKEVLLKAVIQSILAYAMSLFRLHRALIKELLSMCTSFW
ncbi:hypothetical protein ACOSQ4_017329 [Xanthoceras sorbifolium]